MTGALSRRGASRPSGGTRRAPHAEWGGLGVLAIWAAAALLTGGLMLRLRDA
jgi:hypothetical protein